MSVISTMAVRVHNQKKKFFWCQVFTRLLDVTLTLSNHNLTFRGVRVKANSNDSSPRENVLNIVELAKYVGHV